MKNKTLLVLFAFVLIAVSAFAQDVTAAAAANPGGFTAAGIVSWLTPIVVPLILAGLKKVLPSLPSWTLPVVAPLLGVLVEVINGIALQHQGNLWLAALLGLAGVGIREVKDQLKPAPNGGWKQDGLTLPPT